MPMRCEIVTQDRQLFEGEIDMLVAPGTEGMMGILPNHAPLLTTLNFGELIVRHGDEEEIFVVAGGVMEVQPDAVVVLADAGEHVADIDEERAENARRRAEELLAQGPQPDTDKYLAIQASLRRSELRLSSVRKHRRKTPGIRIERGGET